MANSYPPWATYSVLMACCLVAMDKRPGVCPVGIRDTLYCVISKLVMRVARYRAKTTYGRLQLCAGLEVGIEEVTHAMAQW